MDTCTSWFACCLSAALVTSAACGEGGGAADIETGPVRHMEAGVMEVGGELAARAPDYVRLLGRDLELGLSASDDLAVRSIVRGTGDGLHHVRLQHMHAGVPVVGSELVVHADETTFLGFNGVLTRHLDGFDVTPALSGPEALAIAQADHAGGSPAAPAYERASSQLVIVPGADGRGASLAWQVEFLSLPRGASPAGRWKYFIDDRGGAVLRKYDTMQTAAVVQASGRSGNAIHAHSWVDELDVAWDDGEYELDTDRLKTIDQETGEPARGPLDDMPDASANDAHGYGEVTLDMMRDWMGVDSMDDDGMLVESVVHDEDYCSPACWDGERVHYNDTGYDHPPPGAVELVGHEINHGFTEFHSDLEYDFDMESAGLNEGFSSIAGVITRHYMLGDGAGFRFGTDVTEGGGAIEDLCNPTFRSDYIDHVSDFTPGMDAHAAGAPMGKAFCLTVARMRARTGGSITDAVREVGRIWYQANGAYWTSATDFITACQGTIDAAHALGFNASAIQELRDSWADVGVECAGADSFVCDRDGTCDAGDGESCASCPDDCGACAEQCSGWKKAKCKIGIGDCSRCDVAPGCGDGVCDGEETDATCGQDCGCAATEECQLAPFGCYCDETCLDIGDCCADVASSCQ